MALRLSKRLSKQGIENFMTAHRQNLYTSVDRRSGPVSTRTVLGVTAWTLLMLGCTEVVLLRIAQSLGRYTHSNPQSTWMTPLWYLAAGLIAAGTVLLVWRRQVPTRYRTALFAAVWIGFWGVALLMTRLDQRAAAVLAAGLAWQYTGLVIRWRSWVLRLMRATVAFPVLFVLLGFAIVNRRPESEQPAALSASSSSPNILLIIWDTVRAASATLYGYSRSTTPHLERLGERGVVFDNAFTTAPWTLPAHASMFTGLLPHELAADWEVPLESGPPTLAEVLRDHGWMTVGFAANTLYVTAESGLARGFEVFSDYPSWSMGNLLTASSIARLVVNNGLPADVLGWHDLPGRRNAEEITDAFLGWEMNRSTDRPFFAFLNYFDAHIPYLPPAPFDTLFGPSPADRDPGLRSLAERTAAELQAEIDAYDGAIAYLDEHLRTLLDELGRRGVLDNTIVIVASDHGEEFGENGVLAHGKTLYREVLHVPLVIVAPGAPQGARIPHWVSLRDLPATVLDLAGVEQRLPGTSLARHWTSTPAAVDTLFAQVRFARGLDIDYPVSRGDMHSALAEPFQYIRGGDGSVELYRLDEDPAQQHDLASVLDRPLHLLAAFLDRLLSGENSDSLGPAR